MLIVELSASVDRLLERVDQQIMQLAEGGAGAKFIVAGPGAYTKLCSAISVRNQRGKGTFETYNYLPIVVDPFRDDSLCVVPSPRDCAEGVETYRVDAKD
ncbi:MAG: hypothetical protein KJO98_09950 [Rhodothermia bacterium]|nr:hypothetical protein [Rhodothermia bacterium]